MDENTGLQNRKKKGSWFFSSAESPLRPAWQNTKGTAGIMVVKKWPFNRSLFKLRFGYGTRRQNFYCTCWENEPQSSRICLKVSLTPFCFVSFGTSIMVLLTSHVSMKHTHNLWTDLQHRPLVPSGTGGNQSDKCVITSCPPSGIPLWQLLRNFFSLRNISHIHTHFAPFFLTF